MQQLTMQDIGREIHDGVGQRLTLASIYTQQLLGKNIPLEVKAKAEEISMILNDSLGQLRTLSKELTNEKDYDVDLEKLIAAECKKMENLQICQINYSQNGEVFISNKKAMFIVRILQEFLQNSLKYAECKAIKIDLQKSMNELNMLLSDDGNGFNIHTVSKGIGLKNMKRRAEMIDALININSELSKGTSLHLTLNLL
jgi:signal transduction histidine kinase